MYVEISPRQTGKTTRLLEALIDYMVTHRVIRHRFPLVALVACNQRALDELIGKLEVMGFINSNTRPEWLDYIVTGTGYEEVINKIELWYRFQNPVREPDYWFVDEFSMIQTEKLFPNGMEPMDNAYYSSTPNTTAGRFRFRTGSIYYLTDYCTANDINIKFHNNWTQARLEENGMLAEYMRDSILNDWVDFMEHYGFSPDEIKENWIPKRLKKHKLC